MGYDAFISYSHSADNVAAPALQSALHAFARPWNRMRALHVFRDQTSLAASPELWPAIESALTDARWLLLMASPEAAASHWVAKEIDWWLNHRSVQTMLIILTGGSLAWDGPAGDFDWARTSCLPREAVAGRFRNEPLWIDLSWAKSADVLTLRHARFRQAVLDLAAPLHGRPKDELDGEDVRRHLQVQRLRAGAIAALTSLTVIAGIAAWVAFEQRDEARRQATLAQAGRLTVQADLLRERGGPVDDGVMVAAEAMRMLAAIGERSADADRALRRAMAMVPSKVATLDLSANALRLTPDGERLVATHTADQISLLLMPDGLALGCPYDALKSRRIPQGGERLWLIDALSDDGKLCVVHGYSKKSHVETLELWEADPLRQIAQVTLRSQDGHVKPLVDPAGHWLIATDMPQSGDAAAATTWLWRIGEDGSTAKPQALSGMTAMALSPDGRYLAMSAGLWDLSPTSTAMSQVSSPGPVRVAQWETVPWKVAFSADGGHMATQAGPDSKVVIWELATGKDILRTSPPPGELLALAPAARQLVTAGANATVVWDAAFDAQRAMLPMRAEAAAWKAAGQVLFVVSGVTRIGLEQQQLMTLPEDPMATQSTRFPVDVSGVLTWTVDDNGQISALERHGSSEQIGRADRSGQNGQNGQGGHDTLSMHRWRADTSRWTTTVLQSDVSAVALAPGNQFYAVAAKGQIQVASLDDTGPAVRLAPAVATDLVVFSDGGSHVLAYAGPTTADGPGMIHVWNRADGKHDAITIDAAPSSMLVTKDGRTLVAVAEKPGSVTRAGGLQQLLKWQLGSGSRPTVQDLGRMLHPPASVCEVLNVKPAGGASAAASEMATSTPMECTSTTAAPTWRAEIADRQLLVHAPNGSPVARIDHATKLVQAAVSSDGRVAVTMDEAGHVQRFAIDPKNLIAQACARQPEPLSEELHALLPAPAQAIDACGRTRAPGQ